MAEQDSQVMRKPRIPFLLRLIQWMFPKLESIAPRLAQQWFVSLFFSPPRYSIPVTERSFIKSADQFKVKIWEHTVQCYTWGEGPVVMFVHGWAGRASQFKSIIPHFTNAGYKVISFDAPSHGFSERSKQTTIIDFKNAILQIAKSYGTLEAIVGHSLGGTASLFAIAEGLRVKSLVTISTPTIGSEIIREFASRLGASTNTQNVLMAYIQKKLHRPFDNFMASHFAAQMSPDVRWLILHDLQDREASVENSHVLKQAFAQATMIHTKNLGHNRILRDDTVILAVLDHIRATHLQQMDPVVWEA